MLLVFTVTWLAMFVLFLWAMLKMERQLNDEGQSLFYPWRVPSPKRKGLQVDDAISVALDRLARGDEADDIAWGLQGMTEDGKLVPLQVKKGDDVLYGKYSGTEVNVDGIDYLIVRESDILAIF